MTNQTASWQPEVGEVQLPVCQNIFFAILFYLQLGVVIYFAIYLVVQWIRGTLPDDGIWNHHLPANHDDLKDTYGMDGLSSSSSSPSSSSAPTINRLLYFNLSLIGVAILFSSIAMTLAGTLAEQVIQCTLVTTPVLCFTMAILVGVLGNGGLAVILALSGAIGIWYAASVWHRIPFAAANVRTALAAIYAHWGIIWVAYFFVLLTALFVVVWCLALMSMIVQGYIYTCTNDPTKTTTNDRHEKTHQDDCAMVKPTGSILLTFMLLSLYWTIQVVTNLLHTTVAGVVGTWWFDPTNNTFSTGDDTEGNEREERNRKCHCCSSALYDSLYRSSTFSFGSICLGSFILAIIQVLTFLVNIIRNQQDEEGHRRNDSLCMCLLECLLRQLERLVEYINTWAFGTYHIGIGRLSRLCFLFCFLLLLLLSSVPFLTKSNLISLHIHGQCTLVCTDTTILQQAPRSTISFKHEVGPSLLTII